MVEINVKIALTSLLLQLKFLSLTEYKVYVFLKFIKVTNDALNHFILTHTGTYFSGFTL